MDQTYLVTDLVTQLVTKIKPCRCHQISLTLFIIHVYFTNILVQNSDESMFNVSDRTPGTCSTYFVVGCVR